MAESSMPWDSASPVPSNTFDDIFSSNNSDGYISGTLPGGVTNLYLLPTGATSPVSIATGGAWVNGKRYVNSATITVTIPTPATNPRIDRIVLRGNYAAKSVTVQKIAGTENASPTAPALTQTDGTTWEVSICQVRVTTGGAITITPELVRSEPAGAHLPYELKEWIGTMSGANLVDPRTGAADTRWHTCDGTTVNGIVLPTIANKMIMAAGGTYAAGTTGGAATKALVAHLHTDGSLQTEPHGHGATGLYTGPTQNVTSPSWAVGAAGMRDNMDHTHNIGGTIDGASALDVSGNTANSGAYTQDVLNPYYAINVLCYVGN